MAYAKATLIREIRHLLNDNPFTTACTEAMDTTETDLDVAASNKFNQGDVVEFTDDGERCLVTALADSDTLTVIRNYDGSSGAAVGTGTSHSSGVLVVKNPVFSYHGIVSAIEESIYGLWPYVYRKVSVDITPVAGTTWYELDEASSNTYSGLELQEIVQVVNGKPFYYATRRTAYPARIRFNVPTSVAASGVAIEIPFLRSDATAITVIALGRITPTLETTNYRDLTAGNQTNTVKYFTVAALLERTGISRITQEDITMSDERINPGARENVAQYWQTKAVAERRKWEMDLKATLPRKFKKAGDWS